MGEFHPGDAVRVLPRTVETHHRTPAYVKGKVGRVRALSGRFRNPETRAYGGSGLPKRDLYLVQFNMSDLWGEEYGGLVTDTLVIDVYEQWLERADDPAGREG